MPSLHHLLHHIMLHKLDSDDGEDRDKEGDPLCLSPPMLNAILCVYVRVNKIGSPALAPH